MCILHYQWKSNEPVVITADGVDLCDKATYHGTLRASVGAGGQESVTVTGGQIAGAARRIVGKSKSRHQVLHIISLLVRVKVGACTDGAVAWHRSVRSEQSRGGGND